MARKIILAPTFPRRKEILEETGLVFGVQASDYQEEMTLKMSPEKLAEYLSMGKAETIALKNPDAIIIAGDTFVVYKNKKLGSQEANGYAKKMLKMLTGTKHSIISGVAVIDTKNGKSLSFHDETIVFMKKLSLTTTEKYIETGEPLDKAGAYAIQDYVANLFIISQ